MGVPRSSFYHKKKPSVREIADQQLAQWIESIEQKFFFTIGRCRMGTLIKREFGQEVSEGRIQRVMSKYNLGARIRRIRTAKPHAGKAYQNSLPPNQLNRDFRADKPGYRLVTDVTYVPYYENNQWHWGYLSLVQDLFDRSITAWVFERKQDNRLANRTLRILSFRSLDPAAMLHSDRGSIYTASSFRETLRQMGIEHSFSRRGNCYDNATMECFNGTFKVEALYNPLWSKSERPSFKEQQESIGRYIDFYNKDPPCSVLGNQTPKEFLENYLQKTNRS